MPFTEIRPKALVVFGGTGFVGTAVLAEALSQSNELQLFVVSRTGVAPQWLLSDPLYQTNRIHFLSGDLLKPHTVRSTLRTITSQYHIVACISCVGAITPWSQKNMVQTCGDANVNAYIISKEIKAKKFAVITRDRSNMNDWWYPFPRLIPGYYAGKSKVEQFVISDTQNAGNAICIRAGFVSGTRKTVPGLPTSITINIPLDPMYKIVSRFCPTIDVEDLASAAVRFALSDKKAEEVFVPNDLITHYFK